MRATKILCIRHGESTFNAAWAAAPVDPLHYDARLSALGRAQVRAAREVVLGYPVELVLVSPLTRALQTAVGLFHGHPRAPAMRIVPLLRERVENSCDVGRAPAELASEFPALDFAHLPPVWWHAEGEADQRGVCVEPDAVVRARVDEFRRSLRGYDHGVIAIVGHGTFLRHLTGRALANCEVAELDLG
jgi:broad specificity phosphatase PhoE